MISLALILGSLSIGYLAFGESVVSINEYSFPDNNFRAIISEYYDKNGDGFLTYEERNTTSLPISQRLEDLLGENAVIKDLTGIEFFTNVQRLSLAGIGLTSLDLSKNTALTYVTCMENGLTSIKLGTQRNLAQLDCSANSLTSLDVSGCANLKILRANSNDLTDINLSNNSSLSQLYIYQNELTSLDLKSNTNLTVLECAYNHIPEMDLSANQALFEISSESIGNQWLERGAYISGNKIYINHSFTKPENLISSTLDKVIETEDGQATSSAYTGTAFVTDDIDGIKDRIRNDDGDVMDGFTYKYNVHNSECEDMTVNIFTERNFYQVNFYLDATKEVKLGYNLVRGGFAATAPEMPEEPSCKKIVGWSEDFQNVTTDKDVYLVWKDNHNVVKSFDNGYIDIHCTKCNEKTIKFDFLTAYNTKKGDDRFNPIGDVNNDNVINAKDYAILKRM